MKADLPASYSRSCRRRGRSASFMLKALPSALMLVFANAGWAVDPPPTINVGGAAGLPQNGSVISGSAGGSMSTDGNHLTVTAADRAVLKWGSFSVFEGKILEFVQPNGGAVLNRVELGADASRILGTMKANGTVMLMNPNGVMFGPSSSVNVGALIATTGTIDQDAFINSGRAVITGATGSLVNEGNIQATAGASGLVALVAPSVINQGVITATGGSIVLQGSNTATISLNGGLYELAVPGGATGIEASNIASATLSGKNLYLGVGDAADLLSGVINLEGTQQATDAIVVNGHTVELKSALQAPSVSGSSSTVNVSGAARIQDGVDIAKAGGAVNVAAGTYVQPITLNIDKSLTLSGAGQGTTLIDARGVTGYGVQVTADDVTLKDFTLYGPTANINSAYGIKVAPSGGSASARLHDFSIRDVTIRGSGKAELDLNGVNGAAIDRVTADGAPVGNDAGTTAGAGIQLTDSANVTISNSTTRNNQWGGLALYQANIYYDQQVNNITVAGNNSFTERNPVYLQDLSASRDFGTLNIDGFDFAVRNTTTIPQTDFNQYTWLQRTQQDAFNYAVNIQNAPSAASYVQGWNRSSTTQNFHVGTGNLLGGGIQAMSIGTAVNAVNPGGTVNVAAGNYAESVVVNKANLTITGSDGANLNVAEGQTGFDISANGVTVEDMQITGPYSQDFKLVDWNAVPTTTGIMVRANVSGARIRNNTIKNVRTGVQVLDHAAADITGNTFDNSKGSILLRSDHVTMSGNTRGSSGNEWDIVFLNRVTDGTYFVSPHVSQTQYGSGMMAMSRANGDMHILDRRYGSNGLLGSTPQFGNRSHIVVSAGSNSTAVDDFNLGNGLGNARQPLGFIGDGVNAVVSGGVVEVKAGTYAENVNITKALTLDGAGMEQTILSAPTASGNAVTVEASGVTLSDLSINDSFYGVHVKGVSNNLTIDRVALNNNKYGVRNGTNVTADNFQMLNSSITGGVIGLQTYNGYSNGAGQASFKNARFENVTVDGPSYKGFYFETADNLTMRNVTVTNAGNVGDDSGQYGAGIDVNLKYGAYGSINFDNVVVKNSGSTTSTAVVIKTRGIAGDNSDYARLPASLQSVNIIGGSIEGSTGTGLRMETLSNGNGNGSGGQPTVTISGTQFKNNAGKDIVVDNTSVDARGAVFVGASNGFAIEDRVTHALDGTGRGLVTWETGNVYVTQNSGSIQRGVDAAGTGDTVNVANASFAENVAVNARRDLAFNDTRLQSLTLGSGAAGSGIGGTVTAEGAGGFDFHKDAPIRLLSDTTLATTGADITIKGDIQNAGSVARGLRLIAGTGATRGNVRLFTGGLASNRLGRFELTANAFTLGSTLWVQAFAIDALGDVALSTSTLNTESASRLHAGGNVTGTARGLSTVELSSDKDMNAAISGTDVIARAKGTMQLVVDATNSATLAAETIKADVRAPVLDVAAVQEANISGASQNLTIDAPKGSVSGSFGQVSNTGGGLVNVNGKPQGNQTLSSNSENNRVVPVGEVASGDESGVRVAGVGSPAAQRQGDVNVSTPEAAGDAIDSGQAVELDLSPRKSQDAKEEKSSEKEE